MDGRSASGKSTLAAVLSSAVPGSVAVQTDDVAWHHSFFNWADLLRDGVLVPARAGREVRFRPPAWEQRPSGYLQAAPWLSWKVSVQLARNSCPCLT